MKLAPSLHLIGPGVVNSYLVEEGGLVTVVDAGIPGQWKDLPTELAGMGHSLDDVRALVLTHGDSDHIGFAERLRTERGVPVLVHELDASRARGEAKKEGAMGPMRIGPLLRFLLYGARNGGLRVRPVGRVETFSDGATLDVPGAPRVIGLPGHSKGSVAFHFPSVGALFVGDALTTRSVTTGEIGPQLAPFTADRAEALRSLDRLEAIEAEWLLPGHGEPWPGGVGNALREIRARAERSPAGR
jgi:glyoxylase-like metal-dependent hydrolase (beta-lactamase superfamily II)